ncbi:protein Spt2p [[Candida] railenensis]|uniref:Protein Spt2p n=1 Tax=[Candida] railenensis TaxID=45579 RepID=A0A9P0QKV3_9ASCO|nr:protein Spt2p [[Candida] railenensis]
MSLSNILQQVQRKGQVPVRNNVEQKKQSVEHPAKASRPERPAERVRVVDPVVAKLKAARKLEMEKKEQERKAKLGTIGANNSSKKLKSTIPIRSSAKKVQHQQNAQQSTTGSGRSKQSQDSVRNLHEPAAPRRPPAKKMKFNELMKKASQIDNSKLSINIKHRTSSPEMKENRVGKPPPAKRFNSDLSSGSRGPPVSRGSHDISPKEQNIRLKEQVIRSNPLPMRKPSSALEQKLNRKKAAAGSASASRYRDEYEDDSDNDSFIASDDEEEEDASRGHADYDRDEIWAIFNRGKKRSHFENNGYDSADDMEATGAEILEEEMRSKRRAELEDKREWEEEQRRAAAKRAKKSGR